ncbi:bifunctional phosphoribosylaminoimidazolecarboxamide formyltransferase/IMP cyclohydrolase [Candidatus Micrarchaeota archaeon]|nr:bifunctional phosphoribosylaminoimidazolecarboxamide formyltransferase/IMP cyclohydrolase [Candidatus Micrarchaeota archaeon]
MAPRALVSVFDKRGIADFATGLHKLGYELLSTGQTARLLRDNRIPVREVSDFTGSPEMLNGRVKSMHPAVLSGILFKRSDPDHVKQAGKSAIDLICVNFYPFFEAMEKKKSLDEALELIDIGGPTLVRSAAKNFKDVLVVTSPDQYVSVLDALEQGQDDEAFRRQLAADAFSLMTEYDAAIQNYFSELDSAEGYPERLFLSLKKIQDLRYGENPHQKAALYRYTDSVLSFKDMNQLHGKQLSYNNVLDAQAALELAHDFRDESKAFAAVFKHASPTGAAKGATLLDAYRKAHEADTLSSYGGIAIFNQKLDKPCAEELIKTFMEIVLAPGFETDALQVLKQKRNLRVLEVPRLLNENLYEKDGIRDVVGGVLVQSPDSGQSFKRDHLMIPTKRQPTGGEWEALEFAWRLVKVPKSNCVIFATGDRLIACGTGQQSRVDACQIAIEKSKRANLSVKGSVMASEAFFPFRDTVDFAAQVGITAIVQPGGSKRDPEVIAAADEHGMAMVFTGERHFRH